MPPWPLEIAAPIGTLGNAPRHARKARSRSLSGIGAVTSTNGAVGAGSYVMWRHQLIARDVLADDSTRRCRAAMATCSRSLPWLLSPINLMCASTFAAARGFGLEPFCGGRLRRRTVFRRERLSRVEGAHLDRPQLIHVDVAEMCRPERWTILSPLALCGSGGRPVHPKKQMSARRRRRPGAQTI